MATPAIRMFRKLKGLFCVYKPSGVHWKLVRDTIETNLLKGLDATPSQPLNHEVRFLTHPSPETGASKGLTVSAASVPVLYNHPLGRELCTVMLKRKGALFLRDYLSGDNKNPQVLMTGPEFQRIRVGVGHRLDAFSSGVLVLAVGNGNKTLNDLYQTRVTREYTVEGEFGTATDNFTHTGRVVERSTYDHITQDKLERVLAMLEGVNQKALLMYSNIDMRSQEAYEMAVQGLLGPEGKSAPILRGLRCIHFQPPHFTLEVQCLNETQKYLRKVVHEIGLELRSTAVCKGVRRTRDGPFTLQDALVRHHWTAADVKKAVQLYHPSKKSKKPSKTAVKTPALQTSEENLAEIQQNEANEGVGR